jgi:hypothetical protein
VLFDIFHFSRQNPALMREPVPGWLGVFMGVIWRLVGSEVPDKMHWRRKKHQIPRQRNP